MLVAYSARSASICPQKNQLTCEKIQYKTLSWQLVAVLMIAEIVSNGMLSLPSSLAVVGLVPGIVIIVLLGVFALFTSWILIKFKLRHPEGSRANTIYWLALHLADRNIPF